MSNRDEFEIVRQFTEDAYVDIKGLIEALGIDYAEEPLSGGKSGEISYVDGEYQILVNSSDPEVRKRFTAAHELAHYLFHRDMLNDRGRLNRHTDKLYDADKISNSVKPFNQKHEVEANRIASQILMPRKLVEDQYDKVGDNFEDLAKQFRVSARAMAIRLKVLGLRDQDW